MPSDLQVGIATPNDQDAWEAFINARADAAGYHAWGWRRVFANAFGHEPVYLIAAMGPDKVLRLKPQNLVTGLPVRHMEVVS